MYLVGDSFRVSFKWAIIVSTKQECKSKPKLHTMALSGLVTNNREWGEGGGLQNSRGGCK